MAVLTINAHPKGTGIFTDVHNRTEYVTALLNKHPDIEQWICLGDLVDMFNIPQSLDALEWWSQYDIPLIQGNHELELLNSSKLGDQERKYILGLPKHIRIKLIDDSELLCYHSLPNNPWQFVNKTFTEREFDEYYPIDGQTRGVVIGHNHDQFKLSFPYTDPELWSIGSLGFAKNYAIVEGVLLNFHTL